MTIIEEIEALDKCWGSESWELGYSKAIHDCLTILRKHEPRTMTVDEFEWVLQPAIEYIWACWYGNRVEPHADGITKCLIAARRMAAEAIEKLSPLKVIP